PREGTRRELESRQRRRTKPTGAIHTPITPPPPATGRTENPSSCLFYSCHRREGTDRRGRRPGPRLTKAPMSHRPTGPQVLSEMRPLTIFSYTAASDGPAHHGP